MRILVEARVESGIRLREVQVFTFYKTMKKKANLMRPDMSVYSDQFLCRNEGNRITLVTTVAGFATVHPDNIIYLKQ